jgi:hypothetical protein
MGFDLEATETISSTRLGDWTAIDIVLSRKQYVLCACDNSRLAILLKGAPYHTVAERLPAELGALLASMNLSKELIAEEIGRMDTIHYAKTVNRSILGTLNEYTYQLKFDDQVGRFDHDDLLRMSFKLSGMISLVLKAATPMEATLDIFERKFGRLRLV